MLRLTSAFSLVTWASLLVGTVVLAWRSTGPDAVLYVVIVLLSATAVALSFVMLLRNRPFLLGLCFFLSVLGILPGLGGIGLLFSCIGTLDSSSTRATSVEWFFAATLALMLALPVSWGSLWRDYRHDIALNI